jgi:hypothetical protein
MRLINKSIWNVLILSLVILFVDCLPVAASLPSGELYGYVREADQSTGIANAIVLISCGSLHRMTTTSSYGYYSIECLPSGLYNIMVYDDNGTPILGEQESKYVYSWSAWKCLYAEGGGISGTVMDSSSNPISGAQLTVLLQDRESMVYYATTDGNGEYMVPRLPSGDYIVSVRRSNFGLGVTDDITVATDQVTENQDFTLQAAGSITGTVETTTGQAVSGATVYAVPPGDKANVMFNLERTTTGANGTYTIDWLPTGTYIVVVIHSSYVSDSTTNISVVSGQTNSGNDFSLATQGGAITGTVKDGQTPIEGAIISCYCEGKSCALTETSADGTYSLGNLMAGTYTVFLNAPGYDLDNTTAVVTGTQTTSGVDFNP